MQADAFLFEHLVAPGDEVIVERPTYDRTLLSLRQRGAQAARRRARGRTGSTRTRSRELLAGGARPPKLAHIIPNFQNPAGYTLSLAKREALLALAARARVHGLRGRPLCRPALQRRVAADDALDGPRARRLRVVVLKDRVPGDPRRLSRRAAER